MPADHARTAPLTIGGVTLETAWWGPRPDAAPTIVLLHEGLGCLDLWRDFPERLAATTGCGVFAYSRAGYGRSGAVSLPRPLDYMHREAALLPRVLEAVGIGRRVLVGHSDGASIAAIHAGTTQDFSLCGIALLAPHFFVEEIGLAAIRAAKHRYDSGDLRERLARWHDDPDVAFRGWNDAWLDPGFPAASDLAPELAHIRVPVQIVQGGADPYGTMAQVELAQRETYCPVNVLALPGVGHATHEEAPDATLEALRSFGASAFA